MSPCGIVLLTSDRQFWGTIFVPSKFKDDFMTTQTLLTEWLEPYEKEHIKSRTYSRYQGLITAHIKPMLGEQHIETLSRRDIQDFLSQQKAEGNIRNGGGKLTATSANLMLTVLNLA